MKSRVVTIALLVLTFSTALPAAAQMQSPDQAIEWLNNAERASTAARNLGLPMIVYVTADHCGYCRQMEQETWTNREIARQVDAGFIPLKLHAERDAELVQQLKVRAYPTTLVFTPEGKIMSAAAGYLSPEKLTALLSSAAVTLKTPTPIELAQPATIQVAAPIRWAATAGEAITVARRSNRPILAYVTSDHCGHCRKMEQETWTNPAVRQRVAAGYVPLKVNASHNPKLAAKLRVRVYPTTILLSPAGRPLNVAAGFVSAEKMASLLDAPQTKTALAKGSPAAK